MAKAGNSVLFWALDMSTQQSRAPAIRAISFNKPPSASCPTNLYSTFWVSSNSFQDIEGSWTVILENVCWHIITIQMKIYLSKEYYLCFLASIWKPYSTEGQLRKKVEQKALTTYVYLVHHTPLEFYNLTNST